jgi:hypothetical protein
MAIAHYRTTDGSGTDYVFDIVENGPSDWRAYIVSQPAYGGRDEGTVASHRLGLGTGRPYVCWNKPIRTREDAKKVAAAWADGTQRYIRTGTRLENQ